MDKYDITDYLKDDKELQKAVIDEFLKEIAELKAENEKLKQVNKESAHYLACMTEQRNKANTYLQEIKAIAEQSNVDCIYRISVIRKILTKAESEG